MTNRTKKSKDEQPQQPQPNDTFSIIEDELTHALRKAQPHTVGYDRLRGLEDELSKLRW